MKVLFVTDLLLIEIYSLIVNCESNVSYTSFSIGTEFYILLFYRTKKYFLDFCLSPIWLIFNWFLIAVWSIFDSYLILIFDHQRLSNLKGAKPKSWDQFLSIFSIILSMIRQWCNYDKTDFWPLFDSYFDCYFNLDLASFTQILNALRDLLTTTFKN